MMSFIETLTDADYVDDLALLANTLAQAESLLQAARRIGLYMNSVKTEFICFNKDSAIST